MELRRCPFCGGEAVIEDLGAIYISGGSPGRYYVRCTTKNCVEQNHLWASKQLAAEKWNRRVSYG